MTFLTPLFLAAAAVLAIPLLLHLFRKRDDRVQLFPALRYLRRTSRERAHTLRLRQLLLLALRVAVLACLVLAGARLVLPLGGSDHPPAGIALVVDTGINSTLVTGEQRVLDSLVELGLDVVDRMGETDRIWILPAGRPWLPATPVGRERAREMLRELQPSAARADLPASVARARSLLEAGAPPLREILVLSDLHHDVFPAGGPEQPAGPIRTVVGRPDLEFPPNRALGHVSIGGGLPPRTGAPSRVSIRVDGDSVAGQTIRLYVDGRLVTGGRTDQDGQALLDLPPATTGWLVGRVELDPDALRLDDVRFFALPVRPPPQVRVAPDPPRFLATALDVLAERERIRIGPAGEGGISATESGPPVGIEIEARVISGRRPTLLFPPGDPVRIPAVNRRLEELDAGWRLRVEEPTTAPRTLSESASFLRLPSDLSVTRSYSLEPVAQGRPHTVLARLSDGTPWIVHVHPLDHDGESAPGVLVVGSPPDAESSQLPTSAAMLPFVTAAVELLDGGEPSAERISGESIPLPAEASVVATPSGTRVPVNGTSSFLETGEVGIYDIEDREGNVIARIAVNAATPNPQARPGSDRLLPREAAARLARVPVSTTGGAQWGREALGERRGREAWRPLVAAALLLLLAEGWLAAGAGSGRSSSRNRMDPAP